MMILVILLKIVASLAIAFCAWAGLGGIEAMILQRLNEARMTIKSAVNQRNGFRVIFTVLAAVGLAGVWAG